MAGVCTRKAEGVGAGEFTMVLVHLSSGGEEPGTRGFNRIACPAGRGRNVHSNIFYVSVLGMEARASCMLGKPC